MVQIRNHGGNCCGVKHIHNFSDFGYGIRQEAPTEENITNLLIRFGLESRESGGRSRGKCVEAVVTDQQLKANPNLGPALAANGFRLKTRFSNSTGGMCNVLHRVSGGRDIELAARRNPHIRCLMETVQ